MASWWEAALELGGNFINTILNNEGADDAADAERQGQERAIGLSRDVYRDQRALSLPNYLTGGAATNKLASMLNLPQQDYVAAAAGDPTNSLNQGNFDWNAYLTANPDVGAEWQRLQGNKKNTFKTPQDYAQWHYTTFGKQEGRSVGTPGATPTAPGTGTSSNALSSGYDMQEFWDSPYGKLATEQFLGADNPAIKGAFATQGKALSGAQQIALSDRGRARAGGAFGDYTNSLRSIAGMNQVAGTQIGNALGNYGATAGQGMINIGGIQADKTRELNTNWKNFGKNALSSYV